MHNYTCTATQTIIIIITIILPSMAKKDITQMFQLSRRDTSNQGRYNLIENIGKCHLQISVDIMQVHPTMPLMVYVVHGTSTMQLHD